MIAGKARRGIVSQTNAGLFTTFSPGFIRVSFVSVLWLLCIFVVNFRGKKYPTQLGKRETMTQQIHGCLNLGTLLFNIELVLCRLMHVCFINRYQLKLLKITSTLRIGLFQIIIKLQYISNTLAINHSIVTFYCEKKIYIQNYLIVVGLE